MDEHTLVIRHISNDNEELQFQLQSLPEGEFAGGPVALAAPDSIPVEGRPNSNLSLDLRWYLEQFLEYPFDPYTDVAERIQAALKDWGEQAFKHLKLYFIVVKDVIFSRLQIVVAWKI